MSQPQQEADRATKGSRRLSKVWTKVKAIFKDKDVPATSSGQGATTATTTATAAATAVPTSTPPVNPDPSPSAQEATTTAAAAAAATTTTDPGTQQTATEGQNSKKEEDPSTSRRLANAESDARLQKIKAALEKYDYLLSDEDGDVPITVADFRRDGQAHASERVQKNIRMRVKYTCHNCHTVYGSQKICISCHHKRCPDCTRYPPKKKKGGKGKQSPGHVVGAGTSGRSAETQCACHECRTGFELGAAQCPNCQHQICDLCLKSPELTIAIEPRTEAAGAAPPDPAVATKPATTATT